MSFKLQTEIAKKVIDLKVDESETGNQNHLKINKLLSAECMLAKEYKNKGFFGNGMARMYDIYFYINLFFTGVILAMLGFSGLVNGVDEAFKDTFLLFMLIFTVSITLSFFAKKKNKNSYIFILLSGVLSFNLVLVILSLMTVFKLKNHPFMALSSSEKKEVKEDVEKIKSGIISNVENMKIW